MAVDAQVLDLNRQARHHQLNNPDPHQKDHQTLRDQDHKDPRVHRVLKGPQAHKDQAPHSSSLRQHRLCVPLLASSAILRTVINSTAALTSGATEITPSSTLIVLEDLSLTNVTQYATGPTRHLLATRHLLLK